MFNSDIQLTQEMKKSYLDYSMSVIIGRALPDVRDGLKPVHRRILWSMNQGKFNSAGPYRKSARVVGECFIKGTQINTEQGLKPIEDLKTGDNVFTQNGLKKVTQLFEMPRKPIYRIELENGLVNYCTQGQPMKILTSELQYKWKKISDLKEGDYIVCRSAGSFPNTPISINDIIIDEQIAYFLGIFYAEGWIDRSDRGYDRIAIACNTLEIMNYIKNILHTKFSQDENITGEKIFTIRINNHDLNTKLISTFSLENKYAHNIEVPSFINQSPKSVIYAFISGFIDGDGSIHKSRNVLVMNSVSRQFLAGLQNLLFSLGFCSFLTLDAPKGQVNECQGKEVIVQHDYFRLEVRGGSYRQLIRNLSLQHPSKHTLVNMEQNKEYPSKLEEIPYAGKLIFEEFSSKHLGGGWYQTKNGQKIRAGLKYPSGTKIRYSKDLSDTISIYRSTINELNILQKMEMIDSEYLPFIQEVLEQNLYFIPIKVITNSLEAETYDIEVENDHQFIANGMLSHNCMGKYHPHGDQALYMAIARMAQDFSTRYLMIDGQGNFGSIDGDSPAAMRYTECRLHKYSESLLEGWNEETINFRPNFDNTLEEPIVLPSALPNLLLNGAVGISVGLATNIPPHNLAELADGIVALIENPNLTNIQLMDYVQGPDFPTGGVIYGKRGIRRAYETGRGRIYLRAKAEIIDDAKKGSNPYILITEIPYQINKADLVEQLDDLRSSNNKILKVLDLSNMDGIEIRIDYKTGTEGNALLNYLYANSKLQVSYTISNIALVGTTPKQLALKEILQAWVDHREEIIQRRSQFRLNKARKRLHILEGLQIAMDNIEEIIQIIKGAATDEEIRANFRKSTTNIRILSDEQIASILDIRLRRLSRMEKAKVHEEILETTKTIENLNTLLSSRENILHQVKVELLDVKEKFADKRRTIIADVAEGEDGDNDLTQIQKEQLIPEEPVVVILTEQGYIKALPVNAYRKQHRGGRGKRAIGLREEDVARSIRICSNHDYLLLFTNKAKVYSIRVFDVDPTSAGSGRGLNVRSIVESMDEDEFVTTIVPVSEFTDDQFLMTITVKGMVKRTPLSEFANIRRNGIISMKFKETDDALIAVRLVKESDSVILCSKNGMAIHFPIEELRPLSRGTMGVQGMDLVEGNSIVGVAIPQAKTEYIPSAESVFPQESLKITLPCLDYSEKCGQLLTITENGYGKKTSYAEYRLQHRNGKGLHDIDTSERNGKVVASLSIQSGDEVMCIDNSGQAIRIGSDRIRHTRRNAKGVRLMKIAPGNRIVASGIIPAEIAQQHNMIRDQQQEIENGETGDEDEEIPPEPLDTSENEPSTSDQPTSTEKEAPETDEEPEIPDDTADDDQEPVDDILSDLDKDSEEDDI